MIKNILYKDNGSIDLNIDNTELLPERADIDNSGKTPELLDFGEVGGIPGKEEDKEKNDLKRTGWKEARKATDVKHVCPVCGTRYWGRPNKAYCGTPCKEVAKKRRSRKKKRDIRDFKPHRGKAGEVYFMFVNDKGISKTAFIPAFNAETKEQASKYIDKMCSEEIRGKCKQQVNEVIR
jgi:predicted nucleic acid-binding Zn ribbon protein